MENRRQEEVITEMAGRGRAQTFSHLFADAFVAILRMKSGDESPWRDGRWTEQDTRYAREDFLRFHSGQRGSQISDVVAALAPKVHGILSDLLFSR